MADNGINNELIVMNTAAGMGRQKTTPPPPPPVTAKTGKPASHAQAYQALLKFKRLK